MSTIIYRVENKDFVGPYINPGRPPGNREELDLFYAMTENHQWINRTPGPMDDGIMHRESLLFDVPGGKQWPFRAMSAFIDMKSLMKWFIDEERKILHAVGFRVSMLDVHQIHWIGYSGQCLIMPDSIIERIQFDINSI